MFKNIRQFVVLTVAAGVICCAQAESFSVKGSIFEAAGRENNIDPVLLYSIALVESAVVAPGKKGYLNPFPWTLRTDKPFYGASKTEAEAELNRLIKTNRSVDVGLMQINTRWHGHRVDRITDLLDPLTNVRVAAQILNEQFARYSDDAERAVGSYHSSDPERSRWYARHVLRVYTELQKQAAHSKTVNQTGDSRRHQRALMQLN